MGDYCYVVFAMYVMYGTKLIIITLNQISIIS